MSQTAPVETLPAELEQALVEKIEKQQLGLPALPDVANQVISASFDADCDISRLAKIIERDQLMAGHILRRSNSAMFGGAVQITSLQQALSRLGLKSIRDVALMVSVENEVFRVKGYEEEAQAQFQHSILTAALSQEVARLAGSDVEESFLCGLLHDIGRPVLLQAILDLKVRVEIKTRTKFEVSAEAVRDAVSRHHGRVGADLADSWSMPESFADVIRNHHQPDQAESASSLCHVIHLADLLSHAYLDGDAELETFAENPSLEKLGISRESLGGLLEKLERIAATTQE